MIIQNESKKIAVTEAQISALKNAYKPQMVEINQVTNENIINDIVNEPVQEVVNVPSSDVLIVDEKKDEQVMVENSNLFDQNLISDDPNVSIEKQEPDVVEPVQETAKVEEVVSNVESIQSTPQEEQVISNDNKIQKLFDDFYDLQLHVQQFGVELEEILELFKVKEMKQEVAQASTFTNTSNVEQPVVQDSVSQVVSEQQNVFDTGFNPNNQFTGNIFDMPAQPNVESGMKL